MVLLDLRTMVPVDALECHSIRVPASGPPPKTQAPAARRSVRRRGSASSKKKKAPTSASDGREGKGEGQGEATAAAPAAESWGVMHDMGVMQATSGALDGIDGIDGLGWNGGTDTDTEFVLVPACKCTEGPWTAKRRSAGASSSSSADAHAHAHAHALGASNQASLALGASSSEAEAEEEPSLIYGSGTECISVWRYPVTTWPPPTELELRMSSIRDFSQILDVELFGDGAGCSTAGAGAV